MKIHFPVRSAFVRLSLLFLLLRSTITVLGETEDIVWIEGERFDIIGTDYRSASFANALGKSVAEMCRRYLKAGSHDFQGRILVTLLPEENINFKGYYQIQTNRRGQVSLNIRWNDSLSFETTCRAYTEAYLQHYARFNYGVNADKRIQHWVVSTLVSRIYLSLRPAQRAKFIRVSKQSEVSDIRSLLSMPLSEVDEEGLDPYQGYWLFQILRERGLTLAQLTLLLDRAIAGIDVTNELAEFVVPADEEKSENFLERWWQNQYADYLAQEREFCDSLTTSRSWIEAMGNFGVYRASGGELKDLMELWTFRHNEALRSILIARCAIIRLRMERVNPAYFNSALSIGAFYETVLEAEEKHEFISALIRYLNDWEDAKRLHDRADEILSTCDS